MNLPTLTRGLVIGTVALWVAWDIVAIVRGGYEASETAQIRRWSRYPMVPFGIGLVVGHLLWQSCP